MAFSIEETVKTKKNLDPFAVFIKCKLDLWWGWYITYGYFDDK